MEVMPKGISSERILDYYKETELREIYNHGMLITRHGETVFENYIYPYSAQMPHTLFSVTKSLVSTAVGFAIDENLISLNTKIAPYFKDYKQSAGTENITVRDLLTMHSGKEFSFLQDMTGDYVEIFMRSGFRKTNGFLYSNNDVHILSALLSRVTGMSTVDYLMPRLFTPLGIEKPNWETDCNGICVGGTGGYLRLRDLVKIVQCYADSGKYCGKQVIPEFWTKEATKKQIELDENNPSENGYGYLFWINGNAFSMNGMYGQIVRYYPDYDAIIGFTSCAVDDTKLDSIMEDTLVKAFSEEDTEEGRKKLTDYLSSKDEEIISFAERRKVPSGEFRMTTVSRIISELFFPAGLIPRGISSSMAKRASKSFDCFSFSQSDDEVTVSWYEEGDKVDVVCGLDGNARTSECSIKNYYYKLWSYGFWKNNDLNVVVKPINTLSSKKMMFRFNDNSFTLKVNDTPDFAKFILQNINQVSFLNKSDLLKKTAMVVMKGVLSTATMRMKFVR